MTRPSLLNLLFLTLAVLGSPTQSGAAPTNILFIHMEDMGTQIPAYGDRTVETPNLDRLAGEGVVFERAHVTAATCAASRGSLFTGLYPHQNGIMGFIDTHGFHYREGIPTFVQMLREQGYRCGITYKTGVKPEEAVPFDDKFRFLSNRLRPDDSGHEVNNAVDNFEYFLQRLPLGTPFYFQAQTSDTHAAWNDQRRQDSIKPGSPGWPYPPVDPAKIRPPAHLGNDIKVTDKFRKHLADYYSAIQRVDWYVGQILGLLEEYGYAENTLVVFSADHGPSHLMRGKTTPYELGLRVPFIVRWPGAAKAGIRRDALVSFVDLAPTFLDVAHVERPAWMPGHSLVSVLRGEEPRARREYLYSAYVAHTTGAGSYWPTRTVTDGRFKLIHNLLGDGRTPRFPDAKRQYGHFSVRIAIEASEADSRARAVAARTIAPPEFELYDLQTDSGETINLSGTPKHRELQERLRRCLDRWQSSTVADPFANGAYLDAFTAEYARQLAIYERARAERSKEELGKAKWHLDWDSRIPTWDPKPYLDE